MPDAALVQKLDKIGSIICIQHKLTNIPQLLH